ncbi:MAG TPA: lactonase family protein [Dehalococcoidia bacterium]|jgi:6-phosphogluconolactonase|nr:lactonase family protein [Dehalococcoidia bacterium]
MATYMYVSLQDDDKVLIFGVDSGTGNLTAKGEVPAVGGPSAAAVSPDRKVFYVGHRNSKEISSFQIDPNTGGLTLIGRIPVPDSPTYLSPDRNGRFLLSAYYQGAHVAVHSIKDDGGLGDRPIEWLETAPAAHCIQTDPSNKFAFVPHIARLNDSVMNPPGDVLGPNAIFQFKFDENTGNLTPNAPARVEQSEFLGPRHYCFHPSLDVVYFSDEQGGSVTGYNLDSASGNLSAFQTISTLPEGFSGRNTCSQIQIAPSGKFLYTPNRGHNSIAGFSVDASTGRLTAAGRVSTEAVPSAFSLDPEAKFLYAAGSETGVLASYSINGDSGELTPMETYPVGKRPMEVQTTSL